jgi:hypothetical protein
MVTTATNVQRSVDQPERSTTRQTAWALLATALLAPLPLMVLPPGTGVARALLLVVAVLDIMVGWGLWRLVRRQVPRLGLAVFVSRAGQGVSLAVAALTMAAPADSGGLSNQWWGWFVFAAHMMITAVALQRIGAPALVWVATGLCGFAYLLDALPGQWHIVPSGAVLPFQLGELVLMVWLFVVSRRAAPEVAGLSPDGQ